MGSHFIKESCFVASNEHAAEVIGRNGWKIKSIAYISGVSIKCPQPTEVPIFHISGCKSDVERAKRMIKMWADNFDRMKDKKRSIKCEPGDSVKTVSLNRADISSVIGRHGKQEKKIASMTNVTIISPDANKEPIFILSGKESDLELAIFWIKLTAFSATGANYFEPKQKSFIARILQEIESSGEATLNKQTNFIINFKKLNLISLNQIFTSMKFTPDPELLAEPFKCLICSSTKFSVAKGICGHIISCDSCIVELFQDIYLRCQICSLKVHTFLIVP